MYIYVDRMYRYLSGVEYIGDIYKEGRFVIYYGEYIGKEISRGNIQKG